jgi:hypothetical protein
MKLRDRVRDRAATLAAEAGGPSEIGSCRPSPTPPNDTPDREGYARLIGSGFAGLGSDRLGAGVVRQASPRPRGDDSLTTREEGGINASP